MYAWRIGPRRVRGEMRIRRDSLIRGPGVSGKSGDRVSRRILIEATSMVDLVHVVAFVVAGGDGALAGTGRAPAITLDAALTS